MCEYYNNCRNCGYDHNKCECMGDGSPFCHMFECTIENCQKSECISYEEMTAVFDGDI